MEIKQEVQMPKLHNFFEFKVIDTITNEVVQEARAENVVLDQFYNNILSGFGGYYAHKGFDSLAYGDGTGQVSSDRTSLFSKKGTGTLQNREVVVTPELVTISGKIILLENAYVNGFIREVGCVGSFYNQYYLNELLFTHALLEDSEGNPISIGPKTNTQIIEIYSTVYIQRSPSMTAFPNLFSTVLTGGLPGGARLNNPCVTPVNIGIPGGSWDPITKTYTSGKLRLATGDANAVGTLLGIKDDLLVNNIVFPNLAVFPKYTFLEREIGAGDGIKKDFSFTSGLFVPDSEVIKINGVIKTRGVDYNPYQGGPNTPTHSSVVPLPYGGYTPSLYRSNSAKEKVELVGDLPITPFPAGSDFWVLDYHKKVPIKSILIETNWSDPYYSHSIKIYGSLDGVIWDMVYEYGPYGSTTSEKITLSNLVEYQYLWCGITGKYYKHFDRITLLGGCNILFTTPPAIGDIITARWDADVPPKDDKLFYDIQVAYTASW